MRIWISAYVRVGNFSYTTNNLDIYLVQTDDWYKYFDTKYFYFLSCLMIKNDKILSCHIYPTLVHLIRIELTLLSEPDPKSGASTSSAIGAVVLF